MARLSPTDIELALMPDRFNFAMPVTQKTGYLSLTRDDHRNPSS